MRHPLRLSFAFVVEVIDAVAIVEPDESHEGHIEPDSESHAAAEVEEVGLFQIPPDISAFGEDQSVNRGILHQREAEFEGLFEHSFAAQGDVFIGTDASFIVSAEGFSQLESGAAHKKAFDKGDGFISQPRADASLAVGVEDQFSDYSGEGFGGEDMLMVMFITSEGTAGEFGGEDVNRALGGEFGKIAAVAGDNLGDPGGEDGDTFLQSAGVGGQQGGGNIGVFGMFEAVDPVSAEVIIGPAEFPTEAEGSADDSFGIAVIGAASFKMEKGGAEQGGSIHKPGFGEGDGELAVDFSEIPIQREALTISEEVIHCEAEGANHSIPFGITGGHLGLVGGFFLDFDIKVNLVFGDGFHIGDNIGEVVQDGDFADGAAEFGDIEGVAGFEDEFPADDLFFSFRVSGEIDAADAELVAFDDIEVDIQGVLAEGDFDGNDGTVDVSQVVVHITDAFMGGDIQFLGAVNIARFEGYFAPQFIFGEESVALEINGSEIIETAFLQKNVDEHMFQIIAVVNGIGGDEHIAEAVVVVVFFHIFQIFLEFVAVEFT